MPRRRRPDDDNNPRPELEPPAGDLCGKHGVIPAGEPCAACRAEGWDYAQPLTQTALDLIATARAEAGVDVLYHCQECAFISSHYSEMMEHNSGTGHRWEDRPVASPNPQAELFTETPILRKLLAKFSPERIILLNSQLAQACSEMLSEEAAAEAARTRAKSAELQMRQIGKTLSSPYELADVECFWKVRPDRSVRDLIRSDTEEVIETRPLSEEDRVQLERPIVETEPM